MAAERSGKRQIFVFYLDGEQYAIDVENVREIIVSDEKDITAVPNVPDFISGITNVRGKVVPVIDLEKKLKLASHESDYIVIVELNGAPAGVLVDDVREVMKLDPSKIQEAPEILEKEIHRDYIKDVVVLDKEMIVILDLVKGLEEHEKVAVEQLKDTMDSGSEEAEEEEDITEQDAKKAALERVSQEEEEDEEEQEVEDEEPEEDEDSEQEEVEEETESGDEDSGSEEEVEGESDSEDEAEEDFVCDVCDESFDSKRDLASHKIENH